MAEHAMKMGENRNTGRQRNLEALRCLAMMMVVVLHFLGKGNLLGDVAAADMGAVGICAWILEAFCIVAVNCYMLISGYFLSQSTFKLSRLIKLYLQIWMYSVGVGLFAVITGMVPAEEVSAHYYLSLLFPVSMGHYWFMTAYVFMYLLLPMVGMAVKMMDKQQLKLVLIMVLAVFCGLKSILPFRLEEDSQGYQFIWYLCVFLVAAYIRKYEFGFLGKKRNCALLYLGGCGLILAELFGLRWLYLKTGSFGLLLKISFEYNHIFVLMAAVGLFGWFLNCKGEGIVARVAAKVSPYVLGVYLLHENFGVRYAWQKYFHSEQISNPLELVLWTAVAIIVIFITGVIVEIIRKAIMKYPEKLLFSAENSNCISRAMKKADQMFERK